MILKKISVLGLVFALVASLALQPLVGFAQTATSSNENNNASSSQATSTETTSTSTATTTSNNSSSTPMFALISSQLVNSPSGTIEQGGTATVQATVESQNASTSNAIVDMTFLDQNNVVQGATTTLSGQNLPADTPVTFEATSSPNLLPGAYHLSLKVFSSDRSQKFVTFENVQDFTVSSSPTSTATSTTSTSTATSTNNGGGSSGTSTNATSTPIVATSTISSVSDTGAVVSTTFSNLLPGTNYNFLGLLKDVPGNNLTSSSQSFMTATSSGSGTTSTSSLAISSVSGVSNQDGTGATITWVTNQDANSQVAFGTSTNYTASSSVDSNLVMNHSVNLSGLTPGTLYHFQVMSTNASGTLATSSDQTFTTNTSGGGGGGGGGTTTLDISSIAATSSASGTAATITWVTNENADSQVMFGTSTNYTASSSLDTNLVTDHSVNLSGLTPSTLYHFQVVSKDASGMSVTSSDQTFSTSNGTSTELENRILDLQTQVVALLQQKVQQLINDINSGVLRTQ